MKTDPYEVLLDHDEISEDESEGDLQFSHPDPEDIYDDDDKEILDAFLKESSVDYEIDKHFEINDTLESEEDL